ncbi:transcriptional regulator [Calothrix sp. HK-06]|nr:transcriptional regulator [Calothrix sp. HK-06]
MKHQPSYHLIATKVFQAMPSTVSSRAIFDTNAFAIPEMTTSGFTVLSTSSNYATQTTEATRKATNELRKLSGLTWEQLAKIFNVSRRTLHFWASGQRLSSFHEENLNRLLGTIRYIDRGSAGINRSLLISPGSDGKPLLDLLAIGEYEKVKQILGQGNTPQKPRLVSLSEDTRISRMPPNPADLVDALQDPIHRDIGITRPARTSRKRRNDSGQ